MGLDTRTPSQPKAKPGARRWPPPRPAPPDGHAFSRLASLSAHPRESTSSPRSTFTSRVIRFSISYSRRTTWSRMVSMASASTSARKPIRRPGQAPIPGSRRYGPVRRPAGRCRRRPGPAPARSRRAAVVVEHLDLRAGAGQFRRVQMQRPAVHLPQSAAASGGSLSPRVFATRSAVGGFLASRVRDEQHGPAGHRGPSSGAGHRVGQRRPRRALSISAQAQEVLDVARRFQAAGWR